MRDEQVHVVHADARLAHHALKRLRHGPRRELEDRAAVHAEVVRPVVDGVLRDGIPRAGAGRDEGFGLRAVRAEFKRADAARGVGGLQHDGARAVAEQHTRRPVGHVEVLRDHLRADDQDRLVGTRLDELVGRDEAVHEARAADHHRERARVDAAEPVLDLARHRRREVVRAGGGHDHEVHVFGCDARHLQRPSPGLDAEVARGLILAHEVSPLDA